ncbi:carbon monoxide dehydrogenase subunit G [Sphingosinicellaceae bacterium]|nr:carbon monoxide dehydrogenase subunit G [Sphingosinicellaceae bacterium]
MELKGETRIAAPREAVWTALNDPAVLARCIEGVETLERTTDADGQVRFDGKMNAKVGPVRATFAGGVTVTEPDPPHRYVLVGEGKGGVAGFAKGQAEVVLTADGADTLLTYAVTSSVGGKLAQLGSRLIEGTAKGYAATFFTRFKAEVEGPAESAAVAEFAGGAGDSGLASGAAEAGLADTGMTEGGSVSANLTETAADPQALPAVEAARGGVPPLVWGTVLVIVVAMVLAWQLL